VRNKLAIAALLAFLAVPLWAQTVRPTRVSQLRLTQLTTAQEGGMTLVEGDIWENITIGCIRYRLASSTVCIAEAGSAASGAVLLNPTGSQAILDFNLLLPLLNSTRWVDGTKFTTLAAAIANCPTSGCTVIDNREGAVSISTDIFASANGPVRLLLGNIAYTLSATQNPPNGTTIIGTMRSGGTLGEGTTFIPSTTSLVMFSANNPGGFFQFYIDSVAFQAANLSAPNTNIAFQFTQLNSATFTNLEFNHIDQAFSFDRVRQVSISHNHSFQDTRIGFIGDTTGADHSFEINLNDWTHLPAVTRVDTDPFLILERAVNVHISNLSIQSLGGIADAIEIRNDSQGISIENSTIVNPVRGIELIRNTVGAATGSPLVTRISNVMVDLATQRCVSIQNLTIHVNIDQLTCTSLGASTDGVVIETGTVGVQISDSTFQDVQSGRSGVLVEANTNEFSVTDSVFTVASGGIGINIAAGTSGGFIISGNLFTGAGTKISDNSTGTSKIIAGNTAPPSAPVNNEILQLGPTTFANLGTPINGSFRFCSDCTIANPCAAAGTGALAKRLNGVWVCN